MINPKTICPRNIWDIGRKFMFILPEEISKNFIQLGIECNFFMSEGLVFFFLASCSRFK